MSGRPSGVIWIGGKGTAGGCGPVRAVVDHWTSAADGVRADLEAREACDELGVVSKRRPRLVGHKTGLYVNKNGTTVSKEDTAVVTR